MGVDASVFAVKAKVRVNIDRLYNLDLFRYVEGYPQSPELDLSIEQASDMWSKYRYAEIPPDKLRTIMNLNIELAPYDDQYKYNAWASELVIKLLDLYPDDMFRVIADFEDCYYEKPWHYFERLE